MAAGLALVASFLTLQLMAKHRYHEGLDARLLEHIEERMQMDRLLGVRPHARPTMRAASLRHPANRFVHLGSYRLWTVGLFLFLLANAAIVLIALVTPSLLG